MNPVAGLRANSLTSMLSLASCAASKGRPAASRAALRLERMGASDLRTRAWEKRSTAPARIQAGYVDKYLSPGMQSVPLPVSQISRVFRRPTREFAGPKCRVSLQFDVRIYDVFHPEVLEERQRQFVCLNCARGASQLSDLSRVVTGILVDQLPARVTGIRPTNSGQWKRKGQPLTS